MIVDGNDAGAWASLMAAAQNGDATAYMRLLHEIVPLIRSLARHHIRGADRVEDVVQDVLLTVHRVRHTYDPARPFLPWITAITFRRAIDAGRKDTRVRAWEEQMPELLDSFADPGTSRNDDAGTHGAWLRRAMTRLPHKQRQALELVKLNELSIAQAARHSGQSPAAVKVNIHRGLLALRRMWKAE